MDRLSSMAAFVRTADLGTFAATAAALNMSPQMVAKHVTFLEDRIGARLINRTTRRQSLTEIGRVYLERCRNVLAEAEWADAVGCEARLGPRGRLRVSAPVSFGSTRLVPMMTSYLKTHRGVEVDLVLNDRSVDLVEEEFEAVFRVGTVADTSLVARELAPFHLVACAANSYVRERGMPSNPADLETHELLGYTRGAALDRWRFVRSGQDYETRVVSRLRVNDAKALLSAALDGFGVAMIAEDLASEAIAAGRLVRILPDYDIPARPMHLVYLGDRRQTPKLKSFIGMAMRAFGASRSAPST